jgi:serine/threonine-protein kinase
MDLRPGAVIAGRYRLERKIGEGGMGAVWAAEHIAIGVRVALKTLLPAAAVDQQLVARFRREAYLLGRLRSDRVARVVDFIEDRRYGLVLVMDFVEGEPLAAVLEQRRLSVEEAIDLGVDIVTALCDLHRAKVVHRDLKPDNIILEPHASGRRRAVIVDFGVSRMESGSSIEDEESLTSITQADVAVGTILYMAPEQFLSSRDITGAADLYAVGAILFRALTGHHVYGDGEDMDYAKKKLTTRAPPLVLPRFDRVARALVALVARALERVPDARFESAEAMLAELTSLQDLARATALDLDAATEQAAPPTIADPPAPDTQVDDPAEQTRRMSRPPGLGMDLLEESTLDSPGLPSPTTPPPAMRSVPPVTKSALRITSAPSTGSRQTVPSPAFEPAPPSEPSPEPASVIMTERASAPVSEAVVPSVPAARTFSVRAMVIGIVAALLAGGVLGFEVHRLFAR